MTDYNDLCRMLSGLSEGVDDVVSILANASALLWQYLEDLNWAGFYRIRDSRLVLYPFQGKVACTGIEVGKGVCGTAILTDTTQRVDNVHTFEGHIACDSASNSEIVVPLHVHGTTFGVLDIDSPSFSRFSEEDQRGLEKFSRLLESILESRL